MASLHIDPEAKHVGVDLHGFSVATAMDVAEQLIRQAWENGFTSITLVHGAGTSLHHMSAMYTGYGGIKWSLRSRLYQGDWMEYAYNRRSRQHDINDTAMTLRLRPNPNPQAPPQWLQLSEPEYD